jgi:hypothetical protein
MEQHAHTAKLFIDTINDAMARNAATAAQSTDSRQGVALILNCQLSVGRSGRI